MKLLSGFFMYALQGIIVSCLLFASNVFSVQAQPVALIPWPQQITEVPGSFQLNKKLAVKVAPQFEQGRQASSQILSELELDFSGHIAPQLQISYASELAAESYKLSIDEQGIEMLASSKAGVLYGLQSLVQLLHTKDDGSKVLPYVSIEDGPRFNWRGMHLDVGRHFMPVDFIKRFLDLMAIYKFNRFHWHLTEDQGWRIEIKRYPKLTSVGAWREQTVIGKGELSSAELEYDGKPHGGFYTQQQVKEIVAYAAQRNIMVIPEIEFPGHAQAVIAAYPELGNTQQPLKVKQEWGISTHSLKPSEQMLEFYRNVLTEVMQLFPSPYIHIGGDEVDKSEWRESEFAQQRIKELGLADEHELQRWLIGQINQFLQANNRQMIGWDEIMQGGSNEGAVIMSWRGMQRGLDAAALGHKVIMTPYEWTYFDYFQAEPGDEPLANLLYLPLEQVYQFEPVAKGVPRELRQQVLGAQGQLWTEYIKTPEHVEYMAFPRSIALAEVLWSDPAHKDYQHFMQRLAQHEKKLKQMQVNYREPGNDDISWWVAVEQAFWRVAFKAYHWLHDKY